VLDARLPKRAPLARCIATVYTGLYRGKQVVGLVQAALSYLGKPLEEIMERGFVRLVG
jgi:hypothetical protein